MNKIGSKLIKQIAGIVINSTNQKLVLFTKELSEFVDKLTHKHDGNTIISEDKPGKSSGEEIGSKTDQNKTENKSELKRDLTSSSLGEDSDKETPNKNINDRTTLILNSIKKSSSQTSLLKRLESLNDHLKKYPKSTYYAYQIGAHKTLLKLKNGSNSIAIRQVINETLSIIGHCDPPSSTGVRVLSIDGGGMRGIVAINILQQLEHLSGKKIHQLFDFICGVSTGAIITCCSVPPVTLTLEKLRDLYMELGRQIFKQSALKGAGKLVLSGAYYETSIWEKLLKEQVGSTTLVETTRYPQAPKLCVLSTVGSRLRVVPFLFRNYSLPEQNESNYPGSFTHTMFEAMRASAAAPSVFEEFKTDTYSHIDGGIVANNPAGVAIHEVKSLWPEEDISCLVSCGTGTHPLELEQPRKAASWKMIIDKVLESATDTEGVHTILKDLLTDKVYYRFNPILKKPFPIDEICEEKIKLLEEDTNAFCRQNEDKFLEVVQKLTKSRSYLEKLKDRLKMQIKLVES